VLDDILADITLPKVEPVTINEPDIIAEPVKGNPTPVPPPPPLPVIAEPDTTYNVLGSLVAHAA
jgi:hypothetical protein